VLDIGAARFLDEFGAPPVTRVAPCFSQSAEIEGETRAQKNSA